MGLFSWEQGHVLFNSAFLTSNLVQGPAPGCKCLIHSGAVSLTNMYVYVSYIYIYIPIYIYINNSKLARKVPLENLKLMLLVFNFLYFAHILANLKNLLCSSC